MHPEHKRFLAVNAVGGLAVLGSYAIGLATHPTSRDALWGGVPAHWRGLYTLSMFTATAGYFAFTSFFWLRLDPERVRFFGGRRFPVVTGLYAAILLSAALWMPLTFRHLAQPSDGLWLAVRGVLAVTGAGSLALFPALTTAEPKPGGVHYAAALVGLAAFSFQTAFLDAIMWTAFYPG